MSGNVRAVFFDAGNTLLFPDFDEVARAIEQRGYSVRIEDFYEAERSGKRALDEWLWPLIRKRDIPKTIDPYYWRAYLEFLVQKIGVSGGNRNDMMEYIASHFRKIELWSRVTEDTPPTLAELKKRGFYLGVISNSIGTIEEQLRRTGLRPYFSTVLDSAIIGVEKPSPEIFRLALDRSGSEPGETVFVGDNHAIDMGGAELAGWRGILLDRVRAYPEALFQRVEVIGEVLNVL